MPAPVCGGKSEKIKLASVEESRAAGLLGEMAGKGIMGVALSRRLSFMWIYLACFGLAALVAPTFGITESWREWVADGMAGPATRSRLGIG